LLLKGVKQGLFRTCKSLMILLDHLWVQGEEHTKTQMNFEDTCGCVKVLCARCECEQKIVVMFATCGHRGVLYFLIQP
jgi:hypothetical protein